MRRALAVAGIVGLLGCAAAASAESVESLDNGTVKVGIDTDKGGAITWLSWTRHPGNAVNLHDPGRVIQQSYYAGAALDRRADGQHKAWSPWPWNPIQAGGVGSWARVNTLERTAAGALACETVPKLWDMPDEEAAAVIRQVTGFEPGFDNVVSLECELECRRREDDRWGNAVPRHQELPACYLTRSFGTVKSYLGDGRWRDEAIPPGPPWGRVLPPHGVVACFDATGQGVAIYSPDATEAWNVGPHGDGASADPAAGPCIHVAPIATASLGPRSVFRFQAWLVVGDEEEIAATVDALRKSHPDEGPQAGGDD